MKLFEPKGETFFFSSLVSGLFSSPRIRTLLGICLLILISFQTYGQDENWTLLKEVQGVEIYINVVSCEDSTDASLNLEPSERIKLKFVNETGSSKNVEYFKSIKTSVNSDLVSISISEGTTVVTDCDRLPIVRLTQSEGDGFPTSMVDYFDNFSFSIK